MIFFKKKKKDEKMVKGLSDQILGRLFHEIIHPFKSMQAHLDMVLNLDADRYRYNKATREKLEQIEATSNHLSAILSATIKLYENASIEFNEAEGHMSIVNINTICEMSMIMLEKNVEFNRNYGKNCTVIGNQSSLLQIVINIMKNSIEACNAKNVIGRHDNRIYLLTRRVIENDKSWVSLKIIDNGGGIPEEYMDKIFEDGFSTKTNHATVGYGLSIVKELLSKINGRIEIQSPYKLEESSIDFMEGTMVELFFPKAP